MVQVVFLLAFLTSVAYGQSSRIRTTVYPVPIPDPFTLKVDSMYRLSEEQGRDSLTADSRHTPVFAATYYGTVTTTQFKATVTLHFEINRSEELRIDITDALGKTIFVSSGRPFKKGFNYTKIDLKIKPKGTLYARLSTASGEVRTVKLQQI